MLLATDSIDLGLQCIRSGCRVGYISKNPDEATFCTVMFSDQKSDGPIQQLCVTVEIGRNIQFEHINDAIQMAEYTLELALDNKQRS